MRRSSLASFLADHSSWSLQHFGPLVDETELCFCAAVRLVFVRRKNHMPPNSLEEFGDRKRL